MAIAIVTYVVYRKTLNLLLFKIASANCSSLPIHSTIIKKAIIIIIISGTDASIAGRLMKISVMYPKAFFMLSDRKKIHAITANMKVLKIEKNSLKVGKYLP